MSLAAWRRVGTPEGLSLVQLAAVGKRIRADGWEVVVAESETWAVRFSVEIDAGWRTRSTVVDATTHAGTRRVQLKADRERRWRVDGRQRPELDGCLDVDVAATPFTNTLPIRRLMLQPGEHAEIRVAWIDVPSLDVRPVAQRYTHLEAAGDLDRYEYRSLPSGRRYLLSVDEEGLVVDYESIWTRVQT
ncbi:MAG: putative glycolipid-binding domain-containing protein [Candidatus Limnocylindria bacterium]